VGEPAGLLKIGQDMTDRRNIAEALRESEARFRAVADLVPDLLWRADATGARTWGNRRWMTYTGQELPDAVGTGWAASIHPDDRPAALEEYENAIRAGAGFRQEYRIRSADAQYRWFMTEAAPVRDDEGVVTQWFGSSIDIHDQRTERQTLEERVEERTSQVRDLSHRLTMAEQEERRRVAQILHDDLQQLLYGVDMRMGMMSRSAATGETGGLEVGIEETRGWLAKAINTTRQLTVDLSPPLLPREGLVEAIEWLLRQMKDLHGLDVNLEAEESLPSLDEDVRVLIFHVVRELLFNVKKHAGVDRATVHVGSTGDHLVISVTDEGSGFEPPAEMHANSEPGFGLFSISERMRLIGGHVIVESSPQRGARIKVLAPPGSTSEKPSRRKEAH
jgi:two-component system, chemotaxis family, CheB/CheR fusion protein